MPSRAPIPASAPFSCGNGLLGRGEHLVELVDRVGDLADRGIRVDRPHLVVQVADDLLGRGRDLGCLAQRPEVEAARGRIALQAERGDQSDRGVDDLARDVVDALGDHAHGPEVLADDRHELRHAPEGLLRRLHGLLGGGREPIGDRLEVVEAAVGGGGLEVGDRRARLLEVARAPTSRRSRGTRRRIRRR